MIATQSIQDENNSNDFIPSGAGHHCPVHIKYCLQRPGIRCSYWKTLFLNHTFIKTEPNVQKVAFFGISDWKLLDNETSKKEIVFYFVVSLYKPAL